MPVTNVQRFILLSSTHRTLLISPKSLWRCCSALGRGCYCRWQSALLLLLWILRLNRLHSACIILVCLTPQRASLVELIHQKDRESCKDDSYTSQIFIQTLTIPLELLSLLRVTGRNPRRRTSLSILERLIRGSHFLIFNTQQLNNLNPGQWMWLSFAAHKSHARFFER